MARLLLDIHIPLCAQIVRVKFFHDEHCVLIRLLLHLGKFVCWCTKGDNLWKHVIISLINSGIYASHLHTKTIFSVWVLVTVLLNILGCDSSVSILSTLNKVHLYIKSEGNHEKTFSRSELLTCRCMFGDDCRNPGDWVAPRALSAPPWSALHCPSLPCQWIEHLHCKLVGPFHPSSLHTQSKVITTWTILQIISKEYSLKLFKLPTNAFPKPGTEQDTINV